MLGFNFGYFKRSKLRIPTENLLALYKMVDGSLVYTIGVSVSELYMLFDPYWRPVFFADSNTLRPAMDVYAIVALDPAINIAGGKVFYSATGEIVAVYLVSPVESTERVLWQHTRLISRLL